MRVAVAFDNFGPYHIARLRAVAECCDLLAIQAAPTSYEYGWKGIRSVPFRHINLCESGVSSACSTIFLSSRFTTELAQSSIDVLCLPGWSGRLTGAGLRWASQHHVPVVVMSESTQFDGQRRWWKETAKSRIVSHCSTALAGGSPQCEYLCLLGMPRDCVFLGYDVVDNAHFRTGAAAVRRDRVVARRSLKLPRPFLLASARFIEKKNLVALLEAYAIARDRLRNEVWDLVLLGDGPLRSILVRKITDLHLSTHVHMPGFQDYEVLPQFYGLADAFVHVSMIDQWGLVVNEAMASGLPVIVSDRCGCVRDLIQPGRNGFVCDPCDIFGIADCLMQMIQLPASDRQRMADASSEIVTAWGPDRFALGLLAAAERAIQVGPKSAGFIDRMLIAQLKRSGH